MVVFYSQGQEKSVDQTALQVRGNYWQRPRITYGGGDQGHCHQHALHILRSFPDQYSTTSIFVCKKKVTLPSSADRLFGVTRSASHWWNEFWIGRLTPTTLMPASRVVALGFSSPFIISSGCFLKALLFMSMKSITFQKKPWHVLAICYH